MNTDPRALKDNYSQKDSHRQARATRIRTYNNTHTHHTCTHRQTHILKELLTHTHNRARAHTNIYTETDTIRQTNRETDTYTHKLSVQRETQNLTHHNTVGLPPTPPPT